MNHVIYTVLTGGSLVVTTVVWLYLLLVTAREFRSGGPSDVDPTP